MRTNSTRLFARMTSLFWFQIFFLSLHTSLICLIRRSKLHIKSERGGEKRRGGVYVCVWGVWAVNAVKWQAGIGREVVPLKSKLIQGNELTLEHSRLTWAASPDAAPTLTTSPISPHTHTHAHPSSGGSVEACAGSLVVTVETDEALNKKKWCVLNLSVMVKKKKQIKKMSWVTFQIRQNFMRKTLDQIGSDQSISCCSRAGESTALISLLSHTHTQNLLVSKNYNQHKNVSKFL